MLYALPAGVGPTDIALPRSLDPENPAIDYDGGIQEFFDPLRCRPKERIAFVLHSGAGGEVKVDDLGVLAKLLDYRLGSGCELDVAGDKPHAFPQWLVTVV